MPPVKNMDFLEAAPAPATLHEDAAPVVRDKEEPARLAAMEMALQGRTREDILDYLRRTLDEQRAQQVIAGVFDQTMP
jgi:hypothetical protein